MSYYNIGVSCVVEQRGDVTEPELPVLICDGRRMSELRLG